MRGRYLCKANSFSGPLTEGRIYIISDNPNFTKENMECKHTTIYNDGIKAGVNDYWFENNFKFIGPVEVNKRITIL